MRCLYLFVALLSAVAATAPAQAYTIKGSVECSTIFEEHKNENYRAMNRWWLLGYFTARNYIDDADTGAGINEMEIYEVAYNFCRANADTDWDYAAQYTYDYYRK
jgi:hypothetical protein